MTNENLGQDWEEIGSAPRGVWVLLYEPDGVYDTPDFTHWIAKWGYDSGINEGWFDQDDCLVVSNPTYWRHLPPAPNKKGYTK